MPNKDTNSQSDFMIERIKQRPINRRKLLRRTLITASMAVIFGLIACFTFLILEPVISNWLYPEEEAEVQPVEFPEDQSEMSPEEMLAENLPAESPSPETDPTEESVTLDEEQIEGILNRVTLDKDSYSQMYQNLYNFIYDSEDVSGQTSISQYMVTIRGISSNIDWFNTVQESNSQTSGVIIADNGKEFLILADYTSLKNADSLVLELHDGFYQIEAKLKGYDPSTNLAVVAVDLNSIPIEWMEAGGLAVAPMGSSGQRNLAGTPVIAVGSPMGISDSVGYGIITASGTFSATDRNYKLMLTSIEGSKKASGALFNLKGELIGIITNNKISSDIGNMINVYGITELKKVVEKMSNENKLPYMGISGVDVPYTVHLNNNVPYGAYVTDIDMDSPAMQAGIQQGDVITAVDDNAVTVFNEYSNILLQIEPGQTVNLTVMRQVQTEYKEMNFSIVLEESR